MDLQEENQSSRQASAYLLNQVRDYDRHCQAESSIGAASCRWAARVQGLLSEYAAADGRLFHWSGPKSSADIYDPFRYRISAEEILQIRREILAYNDSRCPVTVISETMTRNTVSGTCQSPPANFCIAFADPFDQKTSDDLRWRTVALASECIIPTLVRSRKVQEKYADLVSKNNKTKHYRWLFFILVSVIVDGKIALATCQAMRLDTRGTEEKRRFWQSARRAGAAAIKVVRGISCVVRCPSGKSVAETAEPRQPATSAPDLIEAGAMSERADAAAASVLPAEQTASKTDLKEMELRLIKWIAGAIAVIGVILRLLPSRRQANSSP